MIQKNYQNGALAERSDFSRAKEILIRAGIYQRMGNFAPYTPSRVNRIHRVLETIVIEGMEFTIIEQEVMSFSFDLMSVSKPYMQKEAWFQPVLTQ